ncbi:DUF3560 domain-containing protein [Embleya sp. AB8]|uniref:DUF3560 domain-containing protein n=1 Tax=Embleya sp. AB8 TaxID=3156304 RepID=UPI003C787F61
MATITITHTRAEGTLLDGSRKGDGVFDIVRHHGFWSSRSLGCLYIRQSRDKEAQTWKINAAAEALRRAGHEVEVRIDEDTRRTFAEAEADRAERADERADRFANRADRATSASNARRAASDRISDGIPMGQPILVGHHSERRARRDIERMHGHMRASIEEGRKAGYWSDRARTAENYTRFRNDPKRTMRRLEERRAELRRQERHLAEANEKGWDGARHERLIADLRDEITHWEGIIAQAEAEGVKFWGPADFVPGDFVLYSGSWYEVHRVNPKTLSIAWNLRLAPKQVMTVEDATSGARVWTHPADYTRVRARCPGEAMRGFLADGKVPGTFEANVASNCMPAGPIREALAAKPKPRTKRRDPRIPAGVKIECPWNATEARLTWLNGRNQPHKDREPVTIQAPEGERFTHSVWSRALEDEVTKYLAAQGFTLLDGHSGGSGEGIVRKITPAPGG